MSHSTVIEVWEQRRGDWKESRVATAQPSRYVLVYLCIQYLITSSSPEPEMQFAVEPPVKPIKANVYRSTAKPKPPLTAEEWTSMAKPKVLIVGAGLGGLMLGHLLHRAKIPFTIFERANEVKNLGKATLSKNRSHPLLSRKRNSSFSLLDKIYRFCHVFGIDRMDTLSAVGHA